MVLGGTAAIIRDHRQASLLWGGLGTAVILSAVMFLQWSAGWILLLPGMAAAAVAFLYPRAGVFLLATAIYFRVRLPVFTQAYPADVIAFLVIGGTIAGRLAAGQRPIAASPVNRVLVVILLIFALSLTHTFDPIKGAINWLRHLQLFLLLGTVVTVLKREEIPRVLTWLLVLAGIFSVWNIAVFIAVGGARRVFGPPGPYFPFFLTLTILHAAAGSVLATQRRQRLAWGGLALVFVLAQIATQTREAMLQVVVTFFVMIGVLNLWARREKQAAIRRRTRMMLIVALVLIALFLTAAISLFERPAERVIAAVEGRSYTITTRLFLWRTGLHAFLDSPLLGIGLGQVQQWDEFLPYWRFDPMSQHARGLGAHNDLVTYAAETGVLGLAAVLWLFIRLNRMAVRVWRRVHTPRELFQLLVVWMPVCAFSARFFFGTHTFYSMAGIVTALYAAMLVRCCLPKDPPAVDIGYRRRVG